MDPNLDAGGRLHPAPQAGDGRGGAGAAASGVPWVVVRCHNDMPLLEETLRALAAQRRRHRLLVADHASRDGGRELALCAGAQLLDVPEDAYMPGRVLNHALELVDGEVVAFVNADCTPQGDDWLEHLLAPFAERSVVATFGRQRPRPGCHPLHARTTEATFGDGTQQGRWRHCFSMAASALRRPVWLRQPFSETLRYSEDLDWTWRARCAGGRIAYVSEAVALHSHNYSVAQWGRRQYGEGRAEAQIFGWTPWQASWLRQVLLPGSRQVLADWSWCSHQREWSAVLLAPWLRAVGAWSRWQGLRDGLREISRNGRHP